MSQPPLFNGQVLLSHSTRAPCQGEDDPRVQQLAEAYATILSILGEEHTSRESLARTPLRAAKAMMELTCGYEQDIDAIVNGAVFDNESNHCSDDEIVIVRDIPFHSLCEHHLLPFHGTCAIGYIPGRKILGLSKFARLVDLFAQRLQVQEKLTKQVVSAINEVVGAYGVICHIEATHSCMCMRGVKKDGSTTVTLASEGIFQQNHQLKQEFLAMIKR